MRIRSVLCALVGGVVSFTLAWLVPAFAATTTQFDLVENIKFANCLRADPATPVVAHVTVVQGSLNDRLTVHMEHVKLGIALTLFTVQNSELRADRTLDPNFRDFGLAWYKSDIQVNGKGSAAATIKTILLNDIFGFDPDVSLLPTNTFHVGLWFDHPADAAPCGFDPTKVTPFNGSHNAGPNAMISIPVAPVNFGPLCLTPNAGPPPRCSP